MIITYKKTAPSVDDCRFIQAIRGVYSLIEVEGKAYIEGNPNPVINLAKGGWFAVPEQYISPEEHEDAEEPTPIPRTIGELRLTYFKAGELEDILNAKTTVELTKEVSELKAKVTSLERL